MGKGRHGLHGRMWLSTYLPKGFVSFFLGEEILSLSISLFHEAMGIIGQGRSLLKHGYLGGCGLRREAQAEAGAGRDAGP